MSKRLYLFTLLPLLPHPTMHALSVFYVCVFYAVILMCLLGVIYSRKAKLTLFDTALFLCLFLLALPSIVFNTKVFVLQYVLVVVSLYFIVGSGIAINYSNKHVFLYVVMPYFISMLLFTLAEPPSRYAILNGDPNYTAIIYFTMFFAINELTKSRVLLFLSFVGIFFVLYMTGSRMLLLILLIYSGYFFLPRIRKVFSSKKTTVFFLISSALAQPVMSYYMDDLFSILTFNEETSRYARFSDSSNRARLNAIESSIDFVIESDDVMWVGTHDYMRQNTDAEYIPHHWFMLISVSYGFYFSCVFLLSLLVLIFKTNSVERFFMSLMFLAAGILGAFPIAICLPSFLILKSNIEGLHYDQ
ncbi:O-antigen ligase family protein [Vibrio vulnificus]|nr:hypothetical protein [Vibrio vulnificus]